MDHDRIALLLAGCTSPAYRRSLAISPHDTLARSGFQPGEVIPLVAALYKLQAQPSQGSQEGGVGNARFGPISGLQYHTGMSAQPGPKTTMPDEWFASYR
jgi:hypothetical protein